MKPLSMQEKQARIESVLEQLLPRKDAQLSQLHAAMRYSTLDGGKRVRPLLVYATGEALGVEIENLDIIAAAIEMIHVYSLIHDDLPAMDNDDLRRGKATNHKAFDEATAILAGDALQAMAFNLLASSSQLNLSAKTRLQIITELSHAAGSVGMVGGQAIDLASVNQVLTLAELEQMHACKTGALIRASILMPAYCANNISVLKIQNLENFARCIGLAFQVQDDILDIESDTKTLGKTQGADIAANKPTYPSIIGLTASKQKLADLYQEAMQSLHNFGNSVQSLKELAGFIVNRIN
jgi:farnesyl diphosphate synthase